MISRIDIIRGHHDDLKMPKHNSDGLINCLRQRQDSLVRGPEGHLTKLTGKLWARTLFFLLSDHQNEMHCPFYQISVPSLLPFTGTIIGAVGRRAGALFFALHRDYFIMTRNFTAVYQDLVPFRSFTVTRSSLPSTGTGKKHGTATLRYRSGQAPTAPNQTAGPLVAST